MADVAKAVDGQDDKVDELSELTPKLKKYRVIVASLVGALLLLVLGTAYFGYQNLQLRKNLMEKPSVSEEASSEGVEVEEEGEETSEVTWLTVNSHKIGDEPRFDYMTFKIDYLSKYVVTTDEMLGSYISRGGSAPPDLTFADRRAVVTPGRYSNMLVDLEHFIIVSTTTGPQNFEDLGNAGWFMTPEEFEGATTQTIGNFEVSIRDIVNPHSGKKAKDALIVFPEGVSYYFQASDEETSEDMLEMLETFDTRGSYYSRLQEEGGSN